MERYNDEVIRRRMQRRQFVRLSMVGAGAAGLALGGRRLSRAQDGTPPASTFDAAACYTPFGETEMVSVEPQEGPFNIALSNSYIGNVWRTQMIKMAKAFVELPEIAPDISEFQVNSSGTDDAAQIAAIENMITNGAQAIIINANSPTGLIPVVEQAVADGIVVVAFDNIVESDQILTINEDQVEMGRRWAQFLVDELGGQGKVLMVNGVDGTSVDRDRRAGAYEVWEANPGITYVEVVGDWDPGKAQTATATALSTNPDIAGVWCQGGTDGVVRAFLDAGLPLVPVAGEAENGFRKQMLEYADQFNGYSIGQTPGMVCVAIRAAIDLLKGMELPRDISIPLPEAKTADLVPGVNVFPDAPDNFFTPIQIEACGVNLTYEEIEAQEV